MTDNQITQWAREAGIVFQTTQNSFGALHTSTRGSQSIDRIRKLCELAAADAFERAAVKCDEESDRARAGIGPYTDNESDNYNAARADAADDCAIMIRALAKGE